MPGQLIDDPTNEEEYISSEDEDFNPEASAAQQAAAASSSESESEEKPGTLKRSKSPTTQRKKPKQDVTFNDEAEDLGFENSGDEGIIREGAKDARRRKRKRKQAADDGYNDGDADSGGEGGFVQTRSMRAANSAAPKKALATIDGTKTDIDALWARLSSAPLIPASSDPPPSSTQLSNNAVSAEAGDEEMITINRTYTFAGQLHTETKVVPRNSAQAQAYLATKDQRAGAAKVGHTEAIEEEEEDKKKEARKGPDGQVLFRPLRRISVWDPNPDGFVKGLPVPGAISAHSAAANAYKESPLKIIDKNHLGLDAGLWRRTPTTITLAAAAQGSTTPATSNIATKVTAAATAKQLKAQRLNVVDKSKLDWAEHVDSTEGAREELDKARRDKRSYLERRDFLERVEDRNEDERARVREKGKP